MQRTYNYTGRKNIEQAEALFNFTGSESNPSFAVEFRMNDSDFPPDASVYVEAHYKETRQRFSFGRISKISSPECTLLSDIDLSGPTLFRVLIVDETSKHGLLLASGENFRADKDIDGENEKSSMLSVVKKPLGQNTWRIEFQTGGNPELCLNSSIPNAIDKMKSDSYFQALILPAALRQVLMYFLWNDFDEDDSLAAKWIEFAENFGDSKPEDKDPVTLMNWVDEVVTEFSLKFELCDRLIKSVMED